MNISHFILAAGWIMYCTLHSLLASVKFKKFSEKKLGRQFKYYRLYYTLFAFAGFVALIIYLLLLPSDRVYSITVLSTTIGCIVTVLGGVIMILCIQKYFMQLSGLRSLVENRDHDQLMISGIHRYVRHPLYAGTFLFIWGLWIMIPSISLLITDVIITAYTIIGIRFEEEKLEKQFGEAYTAYKRTTPMLVPRIRN